MDKHNIIIANNINKYFGNFKALNNLTFSVSEGDIFGFIGKNGAGKTTFMRIMCGLMKPSTGTLDVRKQANFLPQNVRFCDNVNGLEILQFFSGLKDCNVEGSIKLAEELEVDLSRKIRSLSPGQQRKLQLIITTIGSPDILVLDEPTAGLDPSGVQQVRNIIRMLNKRGCTIFISSHVLIELDNLCNSIAVIEKGELLYQGTCSTVYEIETGGIDGKLAMGLSESRKQKFKVIGNILIADIEKQEVPLILQHLYENDIKVFSIKRQGIETLYNNLVKEGL